MPNAKKHTVALLTAGGLAPCLSSAVGGLIERYTELDPSIEILCYLDGYQGLLLGQSIRVDAETRAHAARLHRFGGSPIGNSRVKLTNVKDCVKRGLVKEGQDPLQVAADQLEKDGVDILHTIGGDDTNTTAADLAAFLAKHDYTLTVVGLPKTVDNDVIPIRQSLGAWTAAEQGARFFENVVAEHGANPRMLIIHEVMGRHCGWLTAATARVYHERLKAKTFLPGIGLSPERHDIHGIFLPELEFDIEAEGERLKRRMDELGCVNLFVSEGAGVETIVKEMESRGEKVQRDAFGHVRLDSVNPGKWFGSRFAEKIGAEKVLVQKSGYFARSAPANADDLRLIKGCVDFAVQAALAGTPGVVGHDEEDRGILKAIPFPRIKGGKPFDTSANWFQALLVEIGQAG
ncbi:MAG: pyrophosphate--fructose-6-phosphate 1-phosphotransferase [Puniceicoccaceae bacterium]|nr:MAG: pyrophosphate--fructose-6-phosphate 1-phosphotransferase [Puniceicoccaceae bacterium]